MSGETLARWLEPNVLIQAFGYWGLFFIIFAESGLFLGFFFPGDSLLLVAGVLASQGVLNFAALVPLVFVAAALGVWLGYLTGAVFGPRLFSHSRGWWLNKRHITEAQDYFARYGVATIILARFIPIVRTFAPIAAGLARMPLPLFSLYNLIGALIWAVGVLSLGYFVGRLNGIQHYLNLIIAAIIVASLLPAVFHLRHRRLRRN